MNVAEHYTYRVVWSGKDKAFIGLVAEFPSLSWVADARGEAFEGICNLVDEVVEDMAGTDEEPPVPLTDREYSGRFQVRMPPEAHRDLVVEAAEQNVSLNTLIVSRSTRGGSLAKSAPSKQLSPSQPGR